MVFDTTRIPLCSLTKSHARVARIASTSLARRPSPRVLRSAARRRGGLGLENFFSFFGDIVGAVVEGFHLFRGRGMRGAPPQVLREISLANLMNREHGMRISIELRLKMNLRH